jgi:AraC-like DNA-binding protein
LFIAHFGTPPGKFVAAARMERARGLLLYTNMSATQVAEQAGYPDLSSFSRAFAKYFGQRPKAIRAAKTTSAHA